jgi:hypothetical protein
LSHKCATVYNTYFLHLNQVQDKSNILFSLFRLPSLAATKVLIVDGKSYLIMWQDNSEIYVFLPDYMTRHMRKPSRWIKAKGHIHGWHEWDRDCWLIPSEEVFSHIISYNNDIHFVLNHHADKTIPRYMFSYLIIWQDTCALYFPKLIMWRDNYEQWFSYLIMRQVNYALHFSYLIMWQDNYALYFFWRKYVLYTVAHTYTWLICILHDRCVTYGEPKLYCNGKTCLLNENIDVQLIN